ncbi:MAG: M15 family metallopeptidase, partial [Myxococcales bacterium]|nr:M15 family metallopeptidase [Myxococcales bacterium]
LEFCTDTPYQPERLSTWRASPTPGRETSNHVYGIAIDIDPAENTCCGCVGEWAEHELCQTGEGDPFRQMIMPQCWVKQFQRFGWYWYGYEDIQDTMHFDFLGRAEWILGPIEFPKPPKPTSDSYIAP